MIPWNVTWTTEPTQIDLMSTFDPVSQCYVQLRGTWLRDIYRLYVGKDFHGLIVGTTPERIDEAVRARLRGRVDL